MNPSSRTPEGESNRCSICGKSVRIESSSFPTNDAPCPHCGHLLWFVDEPSDISSSNCHLVGARIAGNTNSSDGLSEREFPITPKSHRTQSGYQQPTPEYKEEPFGTFERVVWGLVAALSTTIVWINDGLTFTTVLWLLGIVVFGQYALPLVFCRLHDFVDGNTNLYLGVVVGWALVPGPLVGVIFGVLLPFIYDCGLSSFSGGLIGLIVSPCFAVIQGLTIVLVLDIVVWIVTGTRLSQKA